MGDNLLGGQAFQHTHGGFRFPGLEDAEGEAEAEEENGQAHGEFLQYVGGLGTPDLIRNPGAEGGSQAFLFRTLHEDHEYHEQADDDENGDDN